METIGSKRSYALIWCMPNNDDDDDCVHSIVSICYCLKKNISLFLPHSMLFVF